MREKKDRIQPFGSLNPFYSESGMESDLKEVMLLLQSLDEQAKSLFISTVRLLCSRVLEL